MRLGALLATLAIAGSFGLSAPGTANAFGTNPDGYGLYSGGPGQEKRYDPRSWYFEPRGYYPYNASRYWVTRSEMRYRYRTMYVGPKYRYYPSWGYPFDR